MAFYHSLIDGFARTQVGGWAFLHVLNPLDRKLMRWTNGRVSSAFGTDFAENSVLLRCTGAKSGAVREIPLLATPFEDGWALVASATGQDRNPSWYYNLKAHPNCSLLVPRRGFVRYVAHEADGEERERAWRAANGQYSGYDVYQTRTERAIPVMILRP